MGAWHRPRRHCHADRGRAPARTAEDQPPRPGPQELRGPRVGVEGAVGLHHHATDAPPGRQRRLGPRVLHHGRQAVGRGHRHLRAAVRAGPDLPRQAPGELGPGAEVRRVRPGSRKRGGRRLPLAHPLPPVGRQRLLGRGHHAAGDHAGRHRRHGAPGRRTLRGPHRQAGAAAAVRPRDPGDCRCLCRPRIRHRGGQGHARA